MDFTLTGLRVASLKAIGIAFLFIVVGLTAGTAEAATPVEVISITDAGGVQAGVVLSNPMGAPSGSYPSYLGVVPMRSLYSGNDMFDLMGGGTYSTLKCDGSLQDAPYFASATSTGTTNISYSFHTGAYSGPWASDPGVNGCSTPGVYFYQWSVGGQSYYFEYYWNGSSIEEITPEWWIGNNTISSTYNTRINTVTVTASSTPTFTVGYFIDTDDFVGQNDRPDTVIVNISNTESTQVDQGKKLILPLSNGYATTTLSNFTEPLGDGNYTAIVNFWNFSTSKFVLNRTSITLNFTIVSGAVTAQSLVSADNALFPQDNTVLEECGLTAIGGCISNSLRFVFYPSTESINTLTGTYNSLSTKIPFVYANQLSSLFNSLYNSPDLASSTISIDILGGTLTLLSVSQIQAVPFLSWLRSIIGYIMWVLFAFLLYRRTLRVFNTNPQ